MWCADVRGCGDVGVGAFQYVNTVVALRVTFDLGKPKISSRVPFSTCPLDLKKILTLKVCRYIYIKQC